MYSTPVGSFGQGKNTLVWPAPGEGMTNVESQMTKGAAGRVR